MTVFNIDDYMGKRMEEIDEKLRKQNIEVLNQMMAGRDVWYSARSRATAALIISVINLVVNALATVAILWICI